MTKAPPRVAVLGLGSIGLRHARNLLVEGASVVGYDPDDARSAALAAAGGEVSADRGRALDGSDAAVIASPSACHLDDLEAAVAAGCHVMVEKPLAHKTDGLAAVLAEADAKGRIVFAALNQRYNPVVTEARRWLREGRLGTLLWGRMIAASYLPDWRPGQNYEKGYAADPRSGGVMFDIIHEFDLAHHLLGPYRVLSSSARNTGTLGIDSEDCADVLLEHEDGCRTALHLDYVTRPAMRVGEFAGTEGRIRVDIAGRRAELLAVDGTVGAVFDADSTIDDDYKAEAAAFLASMCDDAQPLCDASEALRVLESVIAARRMAGLPCA